MTPRLVLLTGPAAGEVYRVLLRGCPLYPAGHPVNEKDGHWWDEVRDYSAAPIAVCQASAEGDWAGAEGDWAGEGPTCCDRVEAAIRSLPGGEAWLVGLVLPVHSEYSELTPFFEHHPATWYPRLWHLSGTRGRPEGQPARLAILAPEPPPLLVERVRAWGGEVWWCSVDEHEGSWARIDPTPARVARDCLAAARTWPEAVRAALGEVAP